MLPSSFIYFFQAAQNVFTSDHVIKVYAPFIKSAAGSVYNYGYTGAALALSLTGVRVSLRSPTPSNI
jgi:hypothetical protein